MWIPDQVGNDKSVMIDSSRRLNLSSFFVIVGLDPTIQKISDSLGFFSFMSLNLSLDYRGFFDGLLASGANTYQVSFAAGQVLETFDIILRGNR